MRNLSHRMRQMHQQPCKKQEARLVRGLPVDAAYHFRHAAITSFGKAAARSTPGDESFRVGTGDAECPGPPMVATIDKVWRRRPSASYSWRALRPSRSVSRVKLSSAYEFPGVGMRRHPPCGCRPTIAPYGLFQFLEAMRLKNPQEGIPQLIARQLMCHASLVLLHSNNFHCLFINNIQNVAPHNTIHFFQFEENEI